MRILYVADVRGIGGLQNWALGLAEAQKKRGHEVAIILPPYISDQEIPRTVANGIPVRACDISRFQDADIVHTYDGSLNPLLKRTMAKLPIVHTSFGASAALFIALGRYLNVGWYLDLLRKWRGLWQEAASSRWADRVIAASQKVKRELCTFYRVPASKIAVIHGGHWKREINADKRDLRRELHLPEDQMLILFVGQRHAYKAFHSMLRCFKKLRSEHKNVVLVTSPPQEVNEEKVIGIELPWYEMPKLYCACDVLVSTSKHEGYSLAYHEAMAYGLPVIIPDCAGIVDLCIPNENAIVLPRWKHFEKRLLEAITQLLEDEHLRLRLGQNARATVEYRTWEWVAQETEKVYQEALALR